MDYNEAMRKLKAKEFSNAYLLYGEEEYLLDNFKRVLIEGLLPNDERETGITVIDDNNIENIITALESIPFFSSRNVVIINDSNLFRAAKNSGTDDSENEIEKVDKRINNLIVLLENMPQKSVAIWVERKKVDKRKKIFKLIDKSGQAIEFLPLKAKDLRQWIPNYLLKTGHKINSEALEYIIGIMSMMMQIPLSFIASELEKMTIYAGERKTITINDVLNVMSSITEASVFVMIDALSQRQPEKALSVLSMQMNNGDSVFRILALFARQMRLLIEVKTLSKNQETSNDIAVKLKLPPFVAAKLLQQSEKFTLLQLMSGLKLLATADYKLKTGQSDNYLLEKFIVDLCNTE